jgi:RNA 2',3'-cyclic 3'-phosphodiesterase
VRLFVAIPLAPDLAQRAATILPEALPGLRRVKTENLHVTLAFLGETPPERLPEVAAAADDAAASVPPFQLRFDRLGRFPERGRPRVIWLGIGEGLASVERAGEGVYRGLRERGLKFDDRPLAPHLTLARVREDATLPEARTVAAALTEIALPLMESEIREIAVVQSVLSPKGPRYTARATASLNAERAR